MGGYSLQFCIEVASGDVNNGGSVMVIIVLFNIMEEVTLPTCSLFIN